MPLQEDDLERRVLAQGLMQIALMSETEPKFLARLRNVFRRGHHQRANEPGPTETDAYAEQFIQTATRLSDDALSKRH